MISKEGEMPTLPRNSIGFFAGNGIG